MAQDDVREKAQIKHFGLSDFSETNRGNQYWPDAKTVFSSSDREVTVELKTKPEFVFSKKSLKSKNDVSTARGFGPKKVKEWKKKTDIFIFSEYSGAKWNGNFNEHYALTPDALDPWIQEKVVKPFNEGRKKYFGFSEAKAKILPLLKGQIGEEDLERLFYTIEVGTSLNDPKIPWKYIKEHGQKINNRQDLENYWRSNGKSATDGN